jgi:hypothetical protein
MKKLIGPLLVIAALGMTSGCSINHPIAKDYPEFLTKNGNVERLPKTSLESDYVIDGKTQNHRYEFRAVTVGYAHLWIVEFGKILDATLNAPYVQSSFGRLEKQSGGLNAAGNLIEFMLENYEFKDYRAYVSMKVVLSHGGKVILSKTYKGEGGAKGGQMWGAGPFGMKSAALDSTKSAIDKILIQFINDIPKT